MNKKQKQTSKVYQAERLGLHYYLSAIAVMITGPAILSAYAFTLWSLTASIGLTKTFLWSVGPLSNWMTWLAFALFLNIVALYSKRLSAASR
ncbi:MAG TPA: hypothetical protein VHZ07_11515 [Bryobacteraceae bacterium]|jgi:hypothetical protein|nr:hypothetical protein [Bryobacteraceae bacterium]